MKERRLIGLNTDVTQIRISPTFRHYEKISFPNANLEFSSLVWYHTVG